jgi:hypothetical protein
MLPAEIILEQLGGRAFIVMTGARDLMSCDGGNCLSLRLPSNFAKDGINSVKIKLEPSDTYSIVFSRVRMVRDKQKGGYDYDKSVKLIAKIEDVYSDNLREVFERHTGLCLVVPRFASTRT